MEKNKKKKPSRHIQLSGSQMGCLCSDGGNLLDNLETQYLYYYSMKRRALLVLVVK